MLKIEHLTKCYGEKRAVDDLSLHIFPGEIYGVAGHSGAGKTTLLKSCCGILPYEDGEITVDGVSMKKNPQACKGKIAYIPDKPDLYEFMTGIQYLNFTADIFVVSAAERQEGIRRYADVLELTNVLEQPVSDYSCSMKQKLAILSAFIRAPKLIIMDEPFADLNLKDLCVLKDIMREICGRGSTIFFSTRIPETAEKFCDRTAILEAGRLVNVGTMEGGGN